jgi:uncharacterized membrane protein
LRSGPPIGVEADLAAVGHDDEEVAPTGELLDVGRTAPAQVGVAATVQQIQHRPAAFWLRLEVCRQEESDLYVVAHGRRFDSEIGAAASQLLGCDDTSRCADGWYR